MTNSFLYIKKFSFKSYSFKTWLSTAAILNQREDLLFRGRGLTNKTGISTFENVRKCNATSDAKKKHYSVTKNNVTAICLNIIYHIYEKDSIDKSTSGICIG